ncbi:hypothetical protein IV417_13070 [Alphaproteobacteria bacterium KMM 3653]|uniref:Ankyrin repeat protein n=1 Tax=Harenicola maris TaxID=2841044 RepID=A0AAP2G4V2_9RHOB|nr:hypothetical protein [Harenicola maris]
MDKSLNALRREAKLLKKQHQAGEDAAIRRMGNDAVRPRHADFLHCIAVENGFASWPLLKLVHETRGMDRAARAARLRHALFAGQGWGVDQILAETPDLAAGDFALQVALYDLPAVQAALAKAPELAQVRGAEGPMVSLAFSQHFKGDSAREADMIAVAEALLAHGADPNDSRPVGAGNAAPLSVLYGAIGRAGNMALGQWLLDHGADPNDGESLYHATELGHHRGLDMLLAAGADPAGTNALLRALDFNDHLAVQKLLAAGADVNEFNAEEVGGEAPWTIPALHQAARRGCDQKMIDLLLDAGADPAKTYQGAGVYGFARAFGHSGLCEALEARGLAQTLSEPEVILAAAAEGPVPAGRYIDTGKLPPAYRDIFRMILPLPGRMDHLRRLVEVGIEYDRPDAEGLTPVQAAGWEGLPEVMEYILSLRPDLSHVNNYGGTLLSTIIHGAENCPQRAERDHIACLELALNTGVALPQNMVGMAGDGEVAAFLAAWAKARPGQVVPG